MARGRDKQQWNHTSVLLAAQFNANPYRKGPPVKADRFHPYLPKAQTRGSGIRLTKSTLHLLAIALKAEGATTCPTA